MSLETQAMRGKLADAEFRKRKLKLRIEGLCNSLRIGLNTILVPVEDLEVAQMAEQMDQLVTEWGELQATLAEIGRLEKELR